MMEVYLTDRRRLPLPGDLEFTPEDMPIDTAVRCLEVAAQSKNGMVVLKGNEPMLYPDIEQLFASIRKRRLGAIVETAGLMPSLGRKLLAESGAVVMVRLYRPGVIGGELEQERRETLDSLRKAGCKMSLCVMVDDPGADYGFSLEAGKALGINTLLYRFSCRLSVSELRPFWQWYARSYGPCMIEGTHLLLDCGSLACGFTDEEYGRLEKCGCKMDLCTPHPGVLPDGRVVHCREMLDYPGHEIGGFKSEAQLTAYFFEQFVQLQGQWEKVEGCRRCLSRLGGVCFGVSLGMKAEFMRRDYLALQEEFRRDSEAASGVMSEKERQEKLWSLGVVSLTLCKHADAVECFEELRGMHPEDGNVHFLLGGAYWEVGRLGEGEDEFRKAARLSDKPVAILAELHKRLVRNGNMIKARLLHAEIERMLASRQQG